MLVRRKPVGTAICKNMLALFRSTLKDHIDKASAIIYLIAYYENFYGGRFSLTELDLQTP
jgi:hypothetical protein